MIFSYYPANLRCEAEENEIIEIVVENPHCLRELISDILAGIDGEEHEYIVSDAGKELDIKKYAEAILNPWTLDFSSKRIKNKLLQLCQDVSFANEELFMTTKSAVLSYMENVIDRIEYPIIYNSDFDELSVFKLLDVAVSEQDANFFERLVDYLRLLSSLCHIKVIFLANLRGVISNDEYAELCKIANYEKLQLIIIETTEKALISGIKRYVIDQDCCIIKI